MRTVASRLAVSLVVISSLACSGLFDVELPDWPEEAPRPPLDVISLDAEAAAALEDEYLPALVLGVARGDQLIAAGQSGTRVVGLDSPADVRDKWHAGSITKSMTATVVASLVAQDGWSWDDTVASAFPEIEAHADWTTVTLDELLKHRAGTPELGLGELFGWRLGDETPAQLRATWVAETLLPQAPGEHRGSHVYSNAGYVLLGAIIEARTGRTWEEMIAERVFEPLGITSAGFGSPTGIHQPWGHLGEEAPLTPIEPGVWSDNPAAMGPAGTVHMTLPDLARYATEHLAVLQGKATVFTDPAYVALHQVEEGEDYAYGWGVRGATWSDDEKVVWHNGSNTMAYALIQLVPGRDLALLCASNGMGDFRAEAVCLEALEGLALDPRWQPSDAAPSDEATEEVVEE
jgi:CubicO group peptidase (beta-lactamase class C family)